MKRITVVMPTRDDSGAFNRPAVIKSITQSGPAVITQTAKVGLPGPKGDPGPGIESNISRITAGTTPPNDPEKNDLWIDLN